MKMAPMTINVTIDAHELKIMMTRFTDMEDLLRKFMDKLDGAK